MHCSKRRVRMGKDYTHSAQCLVRRSSLMEIESTPSTRLKWDISYYCGASNDQKQVRVSGPLTQCGDHGVSLAPVMGLMIEEMSHEQAAWMPQFPIH